MWKYVNEHYEYITKSSFYNGVDLLRALAIVGVLFFHLGFYNIIPFHLEKLGWMGVDLFFVLSGFLIGGMLIDEILKTNEVNFKLFYKRRWLRIYPVYLFATFATIFGNVFFLKVINWDTTQFINQLGSNLVFLQSYVLYNTYYVAEGTWSLVIEEFFYLFSPIVLLIILRITKKNLKVFFWVLVAMYLSGTIVRMITTRNVEPGDYQAFFSHFVKPSNRYDELIAGILVAVIVKKQWYKEHWHKLLYVGLFLCSAIFIYFHKNPLIFADPYNMTFQTIYLPLILSFTFGCILLSTYKLRIENVIVNVIARLSYVLYLVHFLIGIYVVKIHDYDFVSQYLIVFGCSYLVSLFIEYPFIRMYKSKNNNTTEKLLSKNVEAIKL